MSFSLAYTLIDILKILSFYGDPTIVSLYTNAILNNWRTNAYKVDNKERPLAHHAGVAIGKALPFPRNIKKLFLFPKHCLKPNSEHTPISCDDV